VLGIDLRQFDFIARPSSSSYVYDADGNQVTGFKGAHIYLGVDTLAPLAELGQAVLLDLAAQRGHGAIMLSKAGHMLRRSLFDPSMHGNPSGLIYCSPATFEGGAYQERPVTVNRGVPMPLAQLVGQIDRAQADIEWATLEETVRPRADRVRTEYVNTKSAAMGLEPSDLERHLESRTLPATWVLTRDNGEQIPLWQIMLDAPKYHQSTGWRDPLEPEYGVGKAKVFVSHGRVTVTSFAHGGDTDGGPLRYAAYFDLEGFRAAVEAEPQRWTEFAGFTRREDEAGMIDIVRELVEDIGTKAEVRTTLRGKREEQGTLEAMSEADAWRRAYAVLKNGARTRFLELGPLARGHGIKTMSSATFDLVHGRDFKFTPTPPSKFAVDRGLVRAYTDIVVKPPKYLGRTVPVVPGMLNIWRPGPRLTPTKAEPMLWLKLVRHLVPDELERNTLLDWLAFQLQNPGVKSNWQVVLYSEIQGVGKDTMVEPLRWGMGRHNVRDVSPLQLESQFNQWLADGPTLVIMQELDAGTGSGSRRRMENMLKPYCAAPPNVLDLNIKGQPQVAVDNTFGLLVFTNKHDLFDLEQGDRRWLMIECTKEKLDEHFFRELWAWYQTGGMRQVCERSCGSAPSTRMTSSRTRSATMNWSSTITY
jgi:hypothetical protein